MQLVIENTAENKELIEELLLECDLIFEYDI